MIKHQHRGRRGITAAMIDNMVHRGFAEWFNARILNDPNSSPQMINLAIGPLDHAMRYTSYNVKGFHFRTVSRDVSRLTQNSGVYGTFGTRSYVTSQDDQMHLGDVEYYGKLVDIIVLNYNSEFTIPLFKCDWADTRGQRGKRVDNLGITSVNFSRLIHTGASPDDEPYIIADQAQQAYYVPDPKHREWHMVIHVKPRDMYDMGDDEGFDAALETTQLVEPQNFEAVIPHGDEHIHSVR